MAPMVLSLVVIAFALAWPLTRLAIAFGHRLETLDAPGVEGQVKAPARRVPNIGGVAIFLGFALPLIAALFFLTGVQVDPHDFSLVPADLMEHVAGITQKAPDAWFLLGALLILHILGVVDDRQPLGPWLKLGVMLAVAGSVVWLTNTRLLTALDARVGGPWLSITITVLWFAAVTNAVNFLDNMDGLSAGVAAIAAACFLAAATIHEQWFVAACLALLLGSLLGFLVYNFPRPGGARIFMGDGGSLVVGFLLAFLTARTTYYKADAAGGWYAVFMPLVVLAVPLYDLVSVSIIRLRAGKSPMVGDLNHLSHRLVRRGLSKRDAVLVIYGLTGITAIGGISLASLKPWQAILVGVQVMLVLLVLAIYEGRAQPNPEPPRA